MLNEPSVVAVEKGSGPGSRASASKPNACWAARRTGIEAVRPLKDGVIADVDITEIMLRFFLKSVTANRFFKVRPRVVVGVPSGITELERRAVRSSAHAAGAKEVYMVSEPMAAAIGVGPPGGDAHRQHGDRRGRRNDRDRRDRAIGPRWRTPPSGWAATSSTAAIVSFLRKNYNLLIGEPTAEAIKIQIGSAFPTETSAT